MQPQPIIPTAILSFVPYLSLAVSVVAYQPCPPGLTVFVRLSGDTYTSLHSVESHSHPLLMQMSVIINV